MNYLNFKISEGLLHQWLFKKLVEKIQTMRYNNVTKILQWNFDLGKILGVTKIFLKSRFFLISNTRKPLKKHKFEDEHLKQYKCCIALSMSNASDYICRYVHSLIT